MKSRRRDSVDKHRHLKTPLQSLSLEALDQLAQTVAGEPPGPGRAITLRVVKAEQRERQTREDEHFKLLTMAQGQVDLLKRRGPHCTKLGRTPWKDRNARVAILNMYRHIIKFLRGTPRDGSDPTFVADWLHQRQMLSANPKRF